MILAYDCVWTEWLSRDTNGGSGDYERVSYMKDEQLLDYSCVVMDFEARTTSDQTPADQTNQIFKYYSNHCGLSCRNSDQQSGECYDYEVRFCCSSNPPTSPTCSWTNWINTDSAGGSGDWETVCNIKNEGSLQETCNPAAFEARTVDGHVYANQTNEQFDYNDAVLGFLCRNNDQDDDSCQDYEVRFCCPDF